MARVITGVVPSARRAGRFDLVVDGRAVASLSLDAVERLRLQVGAPFGETLAGEVEEAAATQRTYDRALDLLAVRARAARDLARTLVRKGESPAHVAAAIARLEALGFLDDAAFARQFARAKLAGPGFSRRRLQAELARRGVAREVVDAALDDVLADEDVDAGAVIDRVATKKRRTLAGLSREVQRRRLYAFLARRGYAPDEIRAAMSRLDALDER
jgi:regulatory protein